MLSSAQRVFQKRDAFSSPAAPYLLSSGELVIHEQVSFEARWDEGFVFNVDDRGLSELQNWLADVDPDMVVVSEALSRPQFVRIGELADNRPVILYTWYGFGPIVSPVGGYPEKLTRLEVEDASDAITKVTDLIVNHNVDVIKIAVTDNFGLLPRMPVDIIEAIVSTAHGYNRPVFAHIGCAVDFDIAIDGGVDVLAHMPSFFVTDDLLLKAIANDIIITPTLDIYVRASVLPRIRHDNLHRFHRLGGLIALGDDGTGGWPSLQQEVKLMSIAGMSPMDIVVSGTMNAAKAIGAHDYLGTLEPGKNADIIIVDPNWINDVSLLTQPIKALIDGIIIIDNE